MDLPLSLILTGIPIIEFDRSVAPDLTKHFCVSKIHVDNILFCKNGAF